MKKNNIFSLCRKALSGRRVSGVLLAVAVLFSVFPAFCQVQKERPRIGVVLSGGGVKGAAHVGVLRAIEEAGLPVDYIVGTSMGAIVGGCYAMGYSTAQLDSLFRHQDWDFVLSDNASRRRQSLAEREWNERFVLTTSLESPGKSGRSGLLRGQNLGNLLARLTVGYHDSISFDSLSIPFACVATNLTNGEEVVIRQGVPSAAIRASMAIPGVFTPAVLDGKTLVDGGLANNYPVDVARRMGADIVIGSTVQESFADSVGFNTMFDVMERVISLACRNKYEENVRDCDLSMRIPVTEYSMMDFSKAVVDSALARGYATAVAHRAEMDSIFRLLEAHVPSGKWARIHRPLPVLPGKRTYFEVRDVVFENISEPDISAVCRLCRIPEPVGTDGKQRVSAVAGTISLGQIEEAMRLLRDKFLYVDAGYSLLEAEGLSYDLHFRANKRNRSRVGVGARFDTEEMAALLLSANLSLGTRLPSSLGVVGKLGEQYAVTAALTLEPVPYKQFSLVYNMSHSDMDINHNGRRAYNFSYQRHTGQVSFSHLRIRNFSGEVGLKMAYYDFGDILSGNTDLSGLRSDRYFTGYLRLKYNSQDRSYYPTRGSKFMAECSFTTDNLSYLARPHAFSSLSASWESTFSLSERWAILPRLCGRTVLGQDIPLLFRNTIGGELAGKYLEQQLPFTGISRLEPVRDVLAVAAMRLRCNIVGRHYATAVFNTAVESPELSELHRGRYVAGGGLQYGYNSKFGPVEATFSYSNCAEKLLFFVNVGFDF